MGPLFFIQPDDKALRVPPRDHGDRRAIVAAVVFEKPLIGEHVIGPNLGDVLLKLPYSNFMHPHAKSPADMHLVLRGFVVIRLVIDPGPEGAGRAFGRQAHKFSLFVRFLVGLAELATPHIKTARRDVVEGHADGIGVIRRPGGGAEQRACKQQGAKQGGVFFSWRFFFFGIVELVLKTGWH